VTERERGPVLDPATRLGEILFGLIMVLTFTGSLHVATAGREQVRTMLLGALGCNLAWGIVDAVMYVMNHLIERTRLYADLRRLKAARGPEEGNAVVASTLPEGIAEALGPAELGPLRERLLKIPEPPERAGLDRKIVKEAFAVFLLVFCSTFPVAAPFLLFGDAALALRISNGVALAMMFIAGCLVGKYAGTGAVSTGLGVTLIGLVLVGVTTWLGG
jgi:VIT1/CCC1 family predicted Fe2+/Mn2+ transporter